MTTTKDYLTCGECLKEFPLQRITMFIEHKKLDCNDDEEMLVDDPELQCSYCPQGFMTAWALLLHAQLTHNLKIFLEKASRNLIAKVKLTSSLTGTTQQPFATSLSSTRKVISDTQSTDINNLPNSIATTLTQNEAQIQPITVLPGSFTILPQRDTQVQSTILQPKAFVVLKQKNEQVTSLDKINSTLMSPDSIVISKSKPNLLQTVTSIPTTIFIPSTKNINLHDKSIMSVSESIISGTTAHSLPHRLACSQACCGTSKQTDGESLSLNKNTTELSVSGSSFQVVVPTKLVAKGVSDGKSVVAKEAELPPDVNMPSYTDPVSNKEANMETFIKSLSDSTSEASNPTEISDIPEDVPVESETEQDTECCSDQGCGVTVIPGSHQNLQKCCNAVVPKKRKRHMEMKHMPFSWSSSRYAQRRRLQLRNQALGSSYKPSGGTIYIDVQSDALMTDSSCSSSTSSDMPHTTYNTDSYSTTCNLVPHETILKGAEKKPQSLILKPGAIFSIPFEYTLPSSISLSQSSVVPTVYSCQTQGRDKDSPTESFNTAAITSTSTTMVDGYEGFKVTMRTEMGEGSKKKRQGSGKRFQCDKCTLAFNQRIHLTKHMSKHTGIKPYKCDECDYSTVERSHLKVHIRIHTGEKPFKCTYCEYATAQNSTLKIHLKRHHGEKMFQCPNCDKKFTEEQQLKGHEWEHGQPGVSSPELQAVSTLMSLGTLPGTSQSLPTILVPNHSEEEQSDRDTKQSTSPTNQNRLPVSNQISPQNQHSRLESTRQAVPKEHSKSPESVKK